MSPQVPTANPLRVFGDRRPQHCPNPSVEFNMRPDRFLPLLHAVEERAEGEEPYFITISVRQIFARIIAPSHYVPRLMNHLPTRTVPLFAWLFIIFAAFA